MADSLDLQDYLDATGDSSKRTRLSTIVLVVACVLGFVGFLNSCNSGWMLDRLQKSGNPNSDYVKEKLALVKINPPNKQPENPQSESSADSAGNYDKRYENFHAALSRAYVENALTVRVPFFGVAFDVDDLSLLSGIGFVIVLLMLRFNIRNEIVSLRLAFKAAEEASEENPKQLETFYHLLAMKMVLTLPNLEEKIIDWKWNREILQTISKLIYFLPLIVYTFIAVQDYSTLKTGFDLSDIRTKMLIFYTGFFWIIILVLSIWCFRRLKKIDEIWKDKWEIIHPKQIPENLLLPDSKGDNENK